MKFWHALCGATLPGKTDEVLSYGTAAQRADLANKSQVEKEAVIGFMAQTLPKTYSITEKPSPPTAAVPFCAAPECPSSSPNPIPT